MRFSPNELDTLGAQLRAKAAEGRFVTHWTDNEPASFQATTRLAWILGFTKIFTVLEITTTLPYVVVLFSLAPSYARDSRQMVRPTISDKTTSKKHERAPCNP